MDACRVKIPSSSWQRCQALRQKGACSCVELTATSEGPEQTICRENKMAKLFKSKCSFPLCWEKQNVGVQGLGHGLPPRALQVVCWFVLHSEPQKNLKRRGRIEGLKWPSSSVQIPAHLSPTRSPSPSPGPSAPAGTSAGSAASPSLLLFRSESLSHTDISSACHSQNLGH
ncbi:hypothetical protein KOW79_007489 [Hemibagrus wyckioides]|uniref:Uncharacterized protein n=1 Tax=Hemibagrus wyckioides TaxID=337641 RepID=A0A9D3SN16_9TELE|nr:hypothetical protein KOW79_007489 [Hemibagrus wyckioides]